MTRSAKGGRQGMRCAEVPGFEGRGGPSQAVYASGVGGPTSTGQLALRQIEVRFIGGRMFDVLVSPSGFVWNRADFAESVPRPYFGIPIGHLTTAHHPRGRT